MATWKDGPEYAPLAPPASFDAPEIAPLAQPEPAPNPAAGQPLVPPPAWGTDPDLVPLAALAPAEAERRDPAQPFAVVSAAVAPAGSSPASAAVGTFPGRPSFDPRAPFHVGADAPRMDAGPDGARPTLAPTTAAGSFAPPSGPPVVAAFPQFGSTGWFAPYRPPAAAIASRLTWRSWWAAITPLVVVVFVATLVASFWWPLAPVGFLVGYAASFLIRHRISQVRLLGAGLLAVLCFVAFGSMIRPDATTDSVWSTLNAAAWGCTLVALAADAWWVTHALRRGEPAEVR